MHIYDVLNEFKYKFQEEEDYDKKWKLFGSAKDTREKIVKQAAYLDKEQDKFIAQMLGQQTEF